MVTVTRAAGGTMSQPGPSKRRTLFGIGRKSASNDASEHSWPSDDPHRAARAAPEQPRVSSPPPQKLPPLSFGSAASDLPSTSSGGDYWSAGQSTTREPASPKYAASAIPARPPRPESPSSAARPSGAPPGSDTRSAMPAAQAEAIYTAVELPTNFTDPFRGGGVEIGVEPYIGSSGLRTSRSASEDATGTSRATGSQHVSDAAIVKLSGLPAQGARPRQDSAPAAGVRHLRARSHFSIPDVVVTSCEEEGEQQHFEVKVPIAKRRSFVIAQPKDQINPASPTRPKPSSPKRVQPPRTRTEPLIKLDLDIAHLTSKDGGMSGSPTAAVGPTHSPPSTVSSSSGEVKRARKVSLPLLWGGGSKKTEEDGKGVYEQPSPPSSAGSVATLPGASRFPVPTKSIMSKKEARAKAKEEQSLMKELEKVDKMVREHDRKMQKEMAKAKSRERKSASESGGNAIEGASATSRALRRLTIFSASSKARPTPPSPMPPPPGTHLSGHESLARRSSRRMQAASRPIVRQEASAVIRNSELVEPTSPPGAPLRHDSSDWADEVQYDQPVSPPQAVRPSSSSSSIQRALAMSDAESQMLRKKASLRRRPSQQRAESRRSSRVVESEWADEITVQGDGQVTPRPGYATPRPRAASPATPTIPATDTAAAARRISTKPERPPRRSPSPEQIRASAASPISFSRPFRQSSIISSDDDGFSSASTTAPPTPTSTDQTGAGIAKSRSPPANPNGFAFPARAGRSGTLPSIHSPQHDARDPLARSTSDPQL
ncbi:hypothetical protein IE81DRAFT_198559 [Ceraceosorus guamensis]|uniref:Uncharacterized protein n=1 Tax=Ceraceosorus guamensis TaxID=1522189 RepID=A0A316VXF3_9BASI|nr:hypothetical protein IE81DRAFT_198559 [Ceraceosorus guamensis]PWN40971.1 hypothetical protein IE81DRAFT_198559 [Ceraceosorus guamensis]